jgi:hypothetical protein
MALDQAGWPAGSPSGEGPIVVIGHSHGAALAEAGIERGLPIDAILFWSEARGSIGEDGRLREDLAERVRRASRVIASIGGGSQTVVGLIEQNRPFDFVLPDEPDLPLDEERELVPADCVRAAHAHCEAPFASLFDQLEALNPGRVLQVEPPAPVYDSDRILPFVPWDLWPGRPQRIAPPLLRYKCWRVNCDVIRDNAAAAGVPYQTVPKASQDDAGFLHPDLAKDGIHGTPGYGQMVWDQICR